MMTRLVAAISLHITLLVLFALVAVDHTAAAAPSSPSSVVVQGPGAYVVNSTHPHLRAAESLDIVPPDAVLSVTVALCWVGVRGADGMSVDLSDITFTGTNAALAVAFVDDGTCGAETDSMSVDVMIRNIDLTKDGMLVITGNMTHKTKLSIVDTRVVATGATNKITTLQKLVPNFSGTIEESSYNNVAVAFFIGGGAAGSAVRGTVLVESSEFAAEKSSVLARISFGVVIDDLREIAMRGAGSGFLITQTTMAGVHRGMGIARVDTISFRDRSAFSMEHCHVTSSFWGAFRIYDAGPITFEGNAVFRQRSCVIHSGDYGFRIAFVHSVTFRGNSTFVQQHCNITSLLFSAFSVEDVFTMVFTHDSTMVIADSSLETESTSTRRTDVPMLIDFHLVLPDQRNEFAFYNGSLFLLRNVVFLCSAGCAGGALRVQGGGTFAVDTSSVVMADNVKASLPIFDFSNSGGLQIIAASTTSTAVASLVITNSFAPANFVLGTVETLSPRLLFTCLRRSSGILVTDIRSVVTPKSDLKTEWLSVSQFSASCGVCEVNTACFGPNTASVADSASGLCQCTCIAEQTAPSDNATLLPTIPPPVLLGTSTTLPCGPEPAVLSPSPPIMVELAAGPGYYVVNSTNPHLRTASGRLTIVPAHAVLSVTVALCWVGVRGADGMSVDLSDITFTGSNAALAVAFVDDGTCDAQPEGPVSETIATHVIVSNIDLTKDGMLVITGNMTHKTKLSIVDTRVVATGATNKITILQKLVPNFSETFVQSNTAVALFIGGGGRGPTGSAVRGTVLIDSCNFTAEYVVSGQLGFGVVIGDLREIAMHSPGSGFHVTRTNITGHDSALSISRVSTITFRDGSSFRQEYCTMTSFSSSAFAFQFGGSVSFVGHSAFIQLHCTMTCLGSTEHGFHFHSFGSVTFSNYSSFTQLDSSMSCAGNGNGVWFYLLGSVVFSNHSSLRLQRCTVTSVGSEAFRIDNGKWVVFTGGSKLSITDSTIETKLKRNAMRIQFPLADGVAGSPRNELAFYDASLFLLRNVLLKSASCQIQGLVCGLGIFVTGIGTFVVDTSSVVYADNVTANPITMFDFGNSGSLDFPAAAATSASTSDLAANFVITNSFAPAFFMTATFAPTASPNSSTPLIYLSCLRRPPVPSGSVVGAITGAVPGQFLDLSRLSPSCGECEVNTACFGPNTASVADSATSASGCQCTCFAEQTAPSDNATLLPTIPPPVLLGMSTSLPCGPEPAVLSPSPPIMVKLADGPGYYVVNSTHPHLRTASGGLTIVPPDAVLSVTVALCWVGVRGADQMSVDLSDISFAGTNAALAVAFVDDGTCGAVTDSMSVDVMIRNIDLTKDGMLVITGNMTHKTKLSIVDTRVVATGATNKNPALQILVPNFSGNIEQAWYTDVAVALFIGGGGRESTGSLVRGTVLIEGCEFSSEESSVSGRFGFGLAIEDCREIAMRGAGSGFMLTRTIVSGYSRGLSISCINSITFQDNAVFSQTDCTVTSANANAVALLEIGSITFERHSIFNLEGCNITGSSHALLFRAIDSITFADRSTWSVRNCSVAASRKYAIGIRRIRRMVFSVGSTMVIAYSRLETESTDGRFPLSISFSASQQDVSRNEFAFYNSSLFLLRNVVLTCVACTTGGVAVQNNGTFAVDTSSVVHADNVTANRMPIFGFANSGGFEITTAAAATKSAAAANFVITNSFAPAFFITATAPPTTPGYSPLIFLSCLRRPAPNGSIVTALGDAVPGDWESASHLTTSCGVCEVNTACFGPNTASVADSATSASGCQCTCIAEQTAPSDNATLLPTIPPPVLLGTSTSLSCGPEPAVLSPSPPILVELAAGPGYYVVNSTNPHLRTASGGLTIVPPDAVLSVTVALCWVGVRGAEGISVDLSDITFAGTNAALAVAFVDDGTCGAETDSMSVDVMIRNIDLTKDGMLVITGNMTHKMKLSIVDTRVVATGATDKVTTLQGLLPNFSGNIGQTWNTDVVVALFIGGGGRGATGSLVRGTVLIAGCEFSGEASSVNGRLSFGVAIDDLREISMRGAGSGFMLTRTNVSGSTRGLGISRVNSITFQDNAVFSQTDCAVTSNKNAVALLHIGSITFERHSIFNLEGCNVTGNSHGLLFFAINSITFADRSTWSLRDCSVAASRKDAIGIKRICRMVFSVDSTMVIAYSRLETESTDGRFPLSISFSASQQDVSRNEFAFYNSSLFLLWNVVLTCVACTTGGVDVHSNGTFAVDTSSVIHADNVTANRMPIFNFANSGGFEITTATGVSSTPPVAANFVIANSFSPSLFIAATGAPTTPASSPLIYLSCLRRPAPNGSIVTALGDAVLGDWESASHLSTSCGVCEVSTACFGPNTASVADSASGLCHCTCIVEQTAPSDNAALLPTIPPPVLLGMSTSLPCGPEPAVLSPSPPIMVELAAGPGYYVVNSTHPHLRTASGGLTIVPPDAVLSVTVALCWVGVRGADEMSVDLSDITFTGTNAALAVAFVDDGTCSSSSNAEGIGDSLAVLVTLSGIDLWNDGMLVITGNTTDKTRVSIGRNTRVRKFTPRLREAQSTGNVSGNPESIGTCILDVEAQFVPPVINFSPLAAEMRTYSAVPRDTTLGSQSLPLPLAVLIGGYNSDAPATPTPLRGLLSIDDCEFACAADSSHSSLHDNGKVEGCVEIRGFSGIVMRGPDAGLSISNSSFSLVSASSIDESNASSMNVSESSSLLLFSDMDSIVLSDGAQFVISRTTFHSGPTSTTAVRVWNIPKILFRHGAALTIVTSTFVGGGGVVFESSWISFVDHALFAVKDSGFFIVVRASNMSSSASSVPPAPMTTTSIIAEAAFRLSSRSPTVDNSSLSLSSSPLHASRIEFSGYSQFTQDNCSFFTQVVPVDNSSSSEVVEALARSGASVMRACSFVLEASVISFANHSLFAQTNCSFNSDLGEAFLISINADQDDGHDDDNGPRESGFVFDDHSMLLEEDCLFKSRRRSAFALLCASPLSSSDVVFSSGSQFLQTNCSFASESSDAAAFAVAMFRNLDFSGSSMFVQERCTTGSRGIGQHAHAFDMAVVMRFINSTFALYNGDYSASSGAAVNFRRDIDFSASALVVAKGSLHSGGREAVLFTILTFAERSTFAIVDSQLFGSDYAVIRWVTQRQSSFLDASLLLLSGLQWDCTGFCDTGLSLTGRGRLTFNNSLFRIDRVNAGFRFRNEMQLVSFANTYVDFVSESTDNSLAVAMVVVNCLSTSNMPLMGPARSRGPTFIFAARITVSVSGVSTNKVLLFSCNQRGQNPPWQISGVDECVRSEWSTYAEVLPCPSCNASLSCFVPNTAAAASTSYVAAGNSVVRLPARAAPPFTSTSEELCTCVCPCGAQPEFMDATHQLHRLPLSVQAALPTCTLLHSCPSESQTLAGSPSLSPAVSPSKQTTTGSESPSDSLSGESPSLSLSTTGPAVVTKSSTMLMSETATAVVLPPANDRTVTGATPSMTVSVSEIPPCVLTSDFSVRMMTTGSITDNYFVSSDVADRQLRYVTSITLPSEAASLAVSRAAVPARLRLVSSGVNARPNPHGFQRFSAAFADASATVVNVTTRRLALQSPTDHSGSSSSSSAVSTSDVGGAELDTAKTGLVATLEVRFGPLDGYKIDESESADVTVRLTALYPRQQKGQRWCEPSAELTLARLSVSPAPDAAVAAVRETVEKTSIVTASVGAVAPGGGGGGGAAGDLQAIAMIGLMACSGTFSKRALASYRAMSPTALSDTAQGALLGSLVVIGAATVLSLLAVLVGFAVLAKKKKNKNKKDSGRSNQDELLVRETASGKEQPASLLTNTLAKVRQPSLLWKVVSVLYPGTVFAASLLASSGDGDDEEGRIDGAYKPIGVAAFCVCLGIPLLLLCHARMYVSATRSTFAYPSGMMGGRNSMKRKIGMLVMPTGDWGPKPVRRSVGYLFGSLARSEHVWIVVPLLSPLLIACAASIQAAYVIDCTAMFAVLGALHFCISMSIAMCLPYRSTIESLLAALGPFLTACVLASSAAATANPDDLDTRDLLLSLASWQALLSVVRIALSIGMYFLIRHLRGNPGRYPQREQFVWVATGAPSLLAGGQRFTSFFTAMFAASRHSDESSGVVLPLDVLREASVPLLVHTLDDNLPPYEDDEGEQEMEEFAYAHDEDDGQQQPDDNLEDDDDESDDILAELEAALETPPAEATESAADGSTTSNESMSSHNSVATPVNNNSAVQISQNMREALRIALELGVAVEHDGRRDDIFSSFAEADASFVGHNPPRTTTSMDDAPTDDDDDDGMDTTIDDDEDNDERVDGYEIL